MDLIHLTIAVHETDIPALEKLAITNWRDREQQASAMLEQALRAQRQRSDPSVPRRTRRSRINGTHTLVAGAIQ